MSPILKFVAYAGREYDGRVSGSCISHEDGCWMRFSPDFSEESNPSYSIDGHLYDCGEGVENRGGGVNE